MPNWAYGTVEATGTQEGLMMFVRRFIDDSGVCEDPKVKYFARSFLDDSREAVIEQIKELAESVPEDEPVTVSFTVSFAWSAYSCLIDGYPQSAADTCITLEDACRQDRVYVHIQTMEPGMYFEEDIICTEDGELTDTSQDLIEVRCPHCGNTQSIASFMDIDDEECCECGEIGMEEIK